MSSILQKTSPLEHHLLKLPLQQSVRHHCLANRLRQSQHIFPRPTKHFFASPSNLPTSSDPPSPRKRFLGLTQPSTNPSRSFTTLETQQAGLSSWTAAFLIGLVGAALLALSSSHSPVPSPQQDPTPPPHPSSSPKASSETAVAATSDSEEENWQSKMTGESQPGRPGTLTPEQEEKLRQFWIAAGRVFGIIDEKFMEELSGNANGTTSPTTSQETKSPEKPHKKRLGFLSRKHKTDSSDADSTTSTDTERARATTVNADDKYGQTKQFQETIAKQSPESLRQTCWSMVKHDHPDALLLRFLRARKWDVDKALVMLISTMNWRHSEIRVDDDVVLNGEEGAVIAAQTKDEAAAKVGSGEDFMAQIRMGKSFLHGHDKLGRPMCIVRARLHKQGEQSEASLERYTVFTIETARMLLAPPVDTACVVFDMNGFSLANMDYGPVKFMIKCFEANYPESLGVVLVHKAPWVFQGIWKIIKGWLDPVVASKVQFTNSPADLEEYIDSEHILKSFGGKEDWEYQYVEPVKGENERMKDTVMRDRLLKEREEVVGRFEVATKEWVLAAEKGRGTKALLEKRNLIAEELRRGYWGLDPYIRARSFYDRTGVLGEGGKVDFYPSANGVEISPLGSGKTLTPGEEDQLASVDAGLQKVHLNGVDHTRTSAADLD